ncbi:MAG: alkaline phosphatase family protein [Candidatus Schekmanbacteria bacterium]|nr:alkaline phosphatase family protein [Candidatus Schekmanbacteria bacterium]
MNNSVKNYRIELKNFVKKLFLLGFIDGIVVLVGTILINDLISNALDGLVLSFYLMIPCMVAVVAVGSVIFTVAYFIASRFKHSIINDGVLDRYTFIIFFSVFIFQFFINRFVSTYMFYYIYPFVDSYTKMAMLMWGSVLIMVAGAFLIGWLTAKIYLYSYDRVSRLKKPLFIAAVMLIIYVSSWLFPVIYNKSKLVMNLASKQTVKAGNYAEGNKVFLIGVDGATWDIIDPMIKRGELKNFKQLIDNGVRGDMKTFIPTESPILWTSIATGKKPEKHGIQSFILVSFDGVSQPIQNFLQRGMFDRLKFMAFTGLSFEFPITTYYRRTNAIWNILSKYGKKVIVVNWFPSYPVEQVNGSMVSDKLLRAIKYERGPNPSEYAKYLVYPSTLCKEIDANMKNYDTPKFYKKKNLTDFVRYTYESENIYFNISMKLLEESPDTNFFTVYFRGTDDLEHKYWKYIDKEKFPWVTDEERQQFGNVINDYYAQVDKYIGKILEKADENTTVIVISDHGHKPVFNYFNDYAAQYGAHGNGPDAIFIASGKNISGGFTIHKPTLYDITPTILYLLGLPAGSDMDGRVLTEIIDRNSLSANPPASISSYDMGDISQAGIEKGNKEMMKDEGLMNKLKALGYIN